MSKKGIKDISWKAKELLEKLMILQLVSKKGLLINVARIWLWFEQWFFILANIYKNKIDIDIGYYMFIFQLSSSEVSFFLRIFGWLGW